VEDGVYTRKEGYNNIVVQMKHVNNIHSFFQKTQNIHALFCIFNTIFKRTLSLPVSIPSLHQMSHYLDKWTWHIKLEVEIIQY